MQWIDPKSGKSFWVGMTRFKGISDAAVDNDLDQLVADCACGSRVAVGPVSGVAVHQPGGPYSVYWARGSAHWGVQSIRIDGAAVLAIAADVATRFGP